MDLDKRQEKYIIRINKNTCEIKRITYNSKNQMLKAQQMLKDMREFAPEALTKSKGHGERSMRKTRSKIKRILEHNLNDMSKFVTLTYKADIKDYNKAYNDFKNMLRKINTKDNKLKYLLVKELQKKNRGGVIHFHLITFNMPELDFSKLWIHGFSYTKDIKNHDYERIGNYFTNYLTKDKNQLIAKNKNIFSYSKNVTLPADIHITKEEYFKYYYNQDIKRMHLKKYDLPYIDVERTLIDRSDLSKLDIDLF